MNQDKETILTNLGDAVTGLTAKVGQIAEKSTYFKDTALNNLRSISVRIKQINETVNRYRTKIEEQEGFILQLQNDNAASEKASTENVQLNEKIQQAEKKISESSTQIHNLTGERDGLIIDNKNIQAELVSANKLIAYNKSAIDKLNETLSTNQTNYETKLNELSKKKKQLEEEFNNNHRTIGILEASLSDVKTQNDSLQQKIVDLTATNATLNEQVNGLNIEITRLKSLEPQLANLKDTNSKLSTQNSDLSGQLAAQKSTNEGLIAEIQTLQSSNSSIQQDIASKTEAITKNEKQIQELTDQINKLNSTLLQITAERDSLIRDRDDILNKISDITKNISDTTAQLDKINGELNMDSLQEVILEINKDLDEIINGAPSTGNQPSTSVARTGFMYNNNPIIEQQQSRQTHGQELGRLPGQRPGQQSRQTPGQPTGQPTGQTPGQVPGQVPGRTYLSNTQKNSNTTQRDTQTRIKNFINEENQRELQKNEINNNIKLGTVGNTLNTLNEGNTPAPSTVISVNDLIKNINKKQNKEGGRRTKRNKRNIKKRRTIRKKKSMQKGGYTYRKTPSSSLNVLKPKRRTRKNKKTISSYSYSV